MGEVADETPTVLLADADVLIDYRESDLSILKEVGKRIARMAEARRTPNIGARPEAEGPAGACAGGRHPTSERTPEYRLFGEELRVPLWSASGAAP